jgi:hypothetical protein
MDKKAIRYFTPGLLAMAAVLAVQPALAQDASFSMSGFGTLGLVATDTDAAEFRIAGQPNGARKRASGEVDSKLAVQLGAKFNPMFSGTVQILSRQNGEGSFKPQVEWAFLKAQLTPELSVRLGRLGAPLFAVSDFRYVGYANVWLRPPQEVYGQIPFSTFNGADLGYSTSIGSATLNVQVFAGKSKDVVVGSDLEVKKFVGANATLDLGNGLALRLGHAQGNTTLNAQDVGGLVQLLRANLGATPFASVAEEIDPTEKKSTFSGLGLSYDEGDWIASAEFTRRRMHSIIPSTTGWFASVGHRFGAFTPYVVVSDLKVDDGNVNNTIPSVGPTAQLSAVVNAVVASQRAEQSTKALGLRWDVARNMALKTQWDRVDVKNAGGLFLLLDPAWSKGKVNVVSVALDFVF